MTLAWRGRSIANVAQATAQAKPQIQRQPGRLADTVGLYHLTAAGWTSWYGFARAIVSALQTDQPLRPKFTGPMVQQARWAPQRQLDDKSTWP